MATHIVREAILQTVCDNCGATSDSSNGRREGWAQVQWQAYVVGQPSKPGNSVDLCEDCRFMSRFDWLFSGL